MYLLGYDIGTSSIKASLVNADTGVCVASAFWPEREAAIIAHQTGWAEQQPEDWWSNLKVATAMVMKQANAAPNSVKAIGISYQMHGLVCVDKQQQVLRPSIIWCDGRAVPYGEKALNGIGLEHCLQHLLNQPGNFTAAKLAWVKQNEPHIFQRIDKIMLPGDYIAMRLTGEVNTTVSGLSEGMFWDFKEQRLSQDIMEFFGFAPEMIPSITPTFGVSGVLTAKVADELGLAPGIPVAYRAGDQPNNALSLNVMNPGQVAATGGTSGVVYGVLGDVNYDPQSRVNTFAHVNHSNALTRLGVLLCINGAGILNAWMKRTVAPEGATYAQMNEMAASVPVGAEGLSVIPFGNGPERMLMNQQVGCSVEGINFNVHTQAHLLRAAQEGVVFAFKQGIDIMTQMGMDITDIHAGHANLFLNPLFREALATVTGATIRLYDTDGAAGAAKGAGIGAGIYQNSDEAFASLKQVMTIQPNLAQQDDYQEAYQRWSQRLLTKINSL